MIYNPHNYQKRATDFVERHKNAALFLDMGLGKTVSTLTAIKNLIDWCEVKRVLVVAPKSVNRHGNGEEAYAGTEECSRHLCNQP